MENASQKHEFQLLHLAAEAGDDDEVMKEMNCLAELANRLDQFHEFKKGQFVKWKAGLQNRKYPAFGEPAIVRAVLSQLDGDFAEFRVDGRRFEPFDGSIE